MSRLFAFSSIAALTATLAVAHASTVSPQANRTDARTTPATQTRPATPQSGAAVHSPGSPEDRAAIKQLADQYAAGWNEGDAKKAASVFSNNAISVGDDGQVQKGRAAIEKDLAQTLSGPMKGTSIKLTMDDVGFLKPDVAVAYGTSDIESSPSRPNKGHYVVTCVKAGGSWKVVAVGTGLDVTH